MISHCWVDCGVGEVLSDGLGHVTDDLDDCVSGELVWRDVGRAVAARRGNKTQLFHLISSEMQTE